MPFCHRDAVRGHEGRAAVVHDASPGLCPRRVGLQLGRLQRDRRQLTAAHDPQPARAGAGPGPVPLVRRRPVSRRTRWPRGVGDRRLHDEQPLPLRPRCRPLAARRRCRSQAFIELCEKQRQGGRRCVRRFRHAVRERRHRPRAPGLAVCVPRSVRIVLHASGGPGRSPALPGGAVPAADGGVLQVSAERRRQVLRSRWCVVDCVGGTGAAATANDRRRRNHHDHGRVNRDRSGRRGQQLPCGTEGRPFRALLHDVPPRRGHRRHVQPVPPLPTVQCEERPTRGHCLHDGRERWSADRVHRHRCAPEGPQRRGGQHLQRRQLLSEGHATRLHRVGGRVWRSADGSRR